MKIETFNSLYGTALTPDMLYGDVVYEIEDKNVEYFYISMNPKDVSEAIADEPEVAKSMKVETVFLEDVGVFIALN